MRRTILIFLLAALLCVPLAGRADAMGALFDAIDELGGKNARFSVVGGLLCATAQKDGETYGFVFDEGGRRDGGRARRRGGGRARAERCGLDLRQRVRRF